MRRRRTISRPRRRPRQGQCDAVLLDKLKAAERLEATTVKDLRNLLVTGGLEPIDFEVPPWT